ncbi:MAG TPA: sterol desaturase family protein [Dissulfurispiraceae bacterium]|nr:sterol desaturase family protein [Dissulfurispiraceae bacterium]
MNMLSTDYEIFIRLGCFFGIFVIMALWEVAAPRRRRTIPRSARWLANIGITGLNSLLVRFIPILSATAASVTAADRGWGIFRIMGFSDLFAGILSVFILDLAIYTQHRVFHTVKPFWRLHKMHHTDLDLDVTSGARFHPIEIVLSMVIKIAIVLLLGAPAWSVILFEVLLNATSMFNHSNVYINPAIDRVLRLFVVTPDMHRVHHSVLIRETNSNYGFNLPWWDRIFGSYRAQPEAGHDAMKIGLANYRKAEMLTLPRLLLVPFDGKER